MISNFYAFKPFFDEVEKHNDEEIFIFFVDFVYEITDELIARFSDYGFGPELSNLAVNEASRKFTQFGGYFKKNGERALISQGPTDGNMHYGLKGQAKNLKKYRR